MSTDQDLKPNPPSQAAAGGPPSPGKLDLSLPKIIGGALAAMTTAALGSQLGVAGTLLGAALASVIAAVATSLYTASLRHTQDKVRTVWTGRSGRAPSATNAMPIEPERNLGRPRRRQLNWVGVTVGAVAAFVIALAAVTVVELASGRALSGGSGTTVNQITEPGGPIAPTTRPGTPAASPTDATPTVSKPTAVPSTSPRPQVDQSGSAQPSTGPSQTPADETPAPTSAPSTSTPSSAPTAATPVPTVSASAG